MTPQEKITGQFLQNKQANEDSLEILAEFIVSASEMLIQCLLKGNKILCCGNGGSASASQHFSSELINRYEMNRPALPGLALTTDSSTITSISNDDHFRNIFARQIKAFAQPGDVLVVFTTSGESINIVEAIKAAHSRNLVILALSGKDGGLLPELMRDEDLELRVPSASTARIQEIHLLITHCLCGMIDDRLFGES
ncbi:MAG TPA: SIS domain-containing protein [Crenotrichaceae bacterium]|nr:SIS domain-containing protein [Crenotrichaceae bacterium]